MNEKEHEIYESIDCINLMKNSVEKIDWNE